MPLFGIDVSHHQGASLDFPALKRAGVEFAFIKASEGATLTDPQFTANLARARAAGMLVAAYHYVRSNASAAAQAARVAGVVPKDVPVIPDVEANSGGVALLRAFVEQLQRASYRVPFTYLPRWYWQQLGSPPLAGLPPLWSSRYPDNKRGTLTDEYAGVPTSYWAGYGGLGVKVLQFTSSARIAGIEPLDANAYLGTREQLTAVLNPDMIRISEEDPMFQTIELPPTAVNGSSEVVIALPWQGGSGGVKSVFAMVCAGADGAVLNVCHWQRRSTASGAELEPGIPMVPDGTTIDGRDRTSGVQAPADVHALIINYSATLGASLVIEAAK